MTSTVIEKAPAPAPAESFRARRLSSSIWLPWFTGLLLMLILAVGSAVLVGRDRGVEGVPISVIAAQERVATARSELFRRSANEAVIDAATAAQQLSSAPAAGFAGTLDEMLKTQERWTSLLVIAADGTVLAHAGAQDAAGLAGTVLPAGQGVEVVSLEDQARLLAYAPLDRPGEPPAYLVGLSSRKILNALLDAGSGGQTYVLDEQGRVLAAGNVIDPPNSLPEGPLRQAAAAASQGSTGSGVPQADAVSAVVVSWAPVSGLGPAGSKQWATVVDRSVSDLPIAEARYRIPGIVFGLVVGLVSLVVFLLIRQRVLIPVRNLQIQTEQVAYGDLSRQVQVGPYDDVGKTGRALERIRIQMIRNRVKARLAASEAAAPESNAPPSNPTGTKAPSGERGAKKGGGKKGGGKKGGGKRDEHGNSQSKPGTDMA